MELYVYRYSKPSRKQERESRTAPCARRIPSHAVIPGPQLGLYPTPWWVKKRCLPEINTVEK